MSPTGTLNKLWESSFASSTSLYLYDLYYDENNNDLLIVAFYNDNKIRIIFFRDLGSSGSTANQVDANFNGQAFQLVYYDSTYIFAVGRT
jgi:hypothetical protein